MGIMKRHRIVVFILAVALHLNTLYKQYPPCFSGRGDLLVGAGIHDGPQHSKLQCHCGGGFAARGNLPGKYVGAVINRPCRSAELYKQAINDRPYKFYRRFAVFEQ